MRRTGGERMLVWARSLSLVAKKEPQVCLEAPGSSISHLRLHGVVGAVGPFSTSLGNIFLNHRFSPDCRFCALRTDIRVEVGK